MYRNRKVVLRADSDGNIGYGHVSRLIALAEQLNDLFYIVFVTISSNLKVLEEISFFSKKLIVINESERFSFLLNYLKGDEIVVLDNYFFDTKYQKKIKNICSSLVCIDDFHHQHYVSDLVINHAPNLNKEKFSHEKYTKLILGLDYALIRKKFKLSNDEISKSCQANKILVCFGGADHKNLSFKYLSYLSKLNFNFHFIFITGQSFLKKEMLDNYIKDNSLINFKHYNNLSSDEIIDFAKKSKFAIVSSSTILYELVSLNLVCFSGYYIENQYNIYNGFKKSGLIIPLNNLEKLQNIKKLLSNLPIEEINLVKKNMLLFNRKKSENFILNEFLKL